MTVDTTTGEILPAAPAAPSAVAITTYLENARQWLATAVEETGPEQIAMAKAEIATAAEATKQLNLSKDIQLDAQEMVRRAEYALGKAIRKGQAEGRIARQGESRPFHHRDDSAVMKARQSDFASDHELRGGGGVAGIYAMTDSVESDEDFDEAIADAKAEGNLSRANVVRKVKGQKDGHQTRDQRADLITELASQGWSSRQMPSRVGVSEEAVRKIARDYGIAIPADRLIGRTKRVNPNDIVENLVTGLEGSVMALDLVDIADLDREQAAEWATSLTESLKKLNRFAKQIKEMTHD